MEKSCIISEVSRTFTVVPNTDPVEYQVKTATTGAIFQINNAKMYVPIVMLSINDNAKFLENMKQGFKRTISRNKYRSEITTQTENNNLIDLIDQHLGVLINCLYFDSEMVIMIL